uniref:NADH-ubiquinone oxidoreductase chain 4 n=1 Tax=Amblyomma fimbriatum TaxID=65641 RepID=H9M770_9ACAR|nr:NADH dehydrogenase subunit 4 [Amblyomma fimbriatum]AET63087.1 NADH dehydrogenase subunit 4 [Amblyomma fimbriatum]
MLMSIIMSFMILCLSFFFSSFEIMLMILMLMIFFFVQISVMESSIFTNQLSLDLMSALLILLSIWISFLMIFASIHNKIFMKKEFLFYVNLMMMLLIMCFLVVNLMVFYFFFESILFPIIMIIFKWGNQPERLQAGFYMLMYTIFGSLPMFVIMIIYFNEMNSLNYYYMNWMENYFMGNLFIFLILGFLVKIPMFLFHLWLPKAHVEAPISGSMILAGILLKLGIYGIMRFKMMMINSILNLSEIFISVSIWGSVMISIFCLYQIDIKALIAYSSVCHMGMVLGGSLSFFHFSSLGMLLLVIGHGLCSSGLFCLANMIYERTFTRSMILFKGLKTVLPSISFWWFMFSIINMSAPMTMNLFGEFFLGLSMLKLSMFFIFPVSLVIFLSACYSIYMFSYINHGQGWKIQILKVINLREFNLLFLHIFPLILWVFKISFFCKWI